MTTSPQRTCLSTRRPNSLAIGALAVSFGATRADDVVFAGTGKSNQSIDSYFGVGIRRFGPPPGGGAAVWTLEATHLAGTWVSRLIVDPDTPAIVYAATGTGFYRRPASGFATWTLLTPSPAPGMSQVTDAAVASTGVDLRYYVAYLDGSTYAYDPGANSWTSLTGIPVNPTWLCLAATRVPGGAASQRVVYALTGSNQLFRLAPGAGTAFTAVAGVPPLTHGQGWYDLAVEIEPGTPDTVWLVGDWIRDPATTQFDLSLFRGTVSTGASPNFGFTNAASPGFGSDMARPRHSFGRPRDRLPERRHGCSHLDRMRRRRLPVRNRRGWDIPAAKRRPRHHRADVPRRLADYRCRRVFRLPGQWHGPAPWRACLVRNLLEATGAASRSIRTTPTG